MVSIVVGVTALGAALMGSGGGYLFWKKTEPNAYDASLFINYKSVYNRNPTPQEQPICWKVCPDHFLDDTQATNIVVIGECKQGKTFVLNRMSGMQLDTNPTGIMEGIKFKRTSWIGADKEELNVMLIDTEGLNHLPGDATNKDLMAKRHGYDQFLQEFSVKLSDICILVTDKPSMSFTHRVTDVCGILQRSKTSRTVIIVYNFLNIEKKDDFFQYFEREVAIRFNCSKFESSVVSYHYSYDTIGGEMFKIVHLPLAREGTEAGKHFNKNTFESLKHLVEEEKTRKDDEGERKFRVREQLVALSPLCKRALGVDWPPSS